MSPSEKEANRILSERELETDCSTHAHTGSRSSLRVNPTRNCSDHPFLSRSRPNRQGYTGGSTVV
ncbi:hypothetical protein TSAR_001277 [Trichomalopsis sarcophagae]|uniref:Uncharacterized protein n=1 Tax=Trichomalopsis sarcophagae TaxID=543379 RepID=A0A232F345_9HYME|nr:hypothetical protein TSAR_001277 [Trichomalopsis sarcophagae]